VRSSAACAVDVSPASAVLPGLVLTLTTTDMPGRSRRCAATPAGTSMRTGSRCTILVKFPVALSGGNSENTEPEAGDRLTTRPSIAWSGSASTLIETGWPGRNPRQLRLLEIGVDIDVVERHEARHPLPGLHIVAGLHGAIAEHAVDRRADDGERQIALGFRLRGLELVERANGLLLLRLQHIEIGFRRLDDRLRAVDGGGRLIAIGLGLLQRLLAGIFLHRERLLPVEFELHFLAPACAEAICAWA
jgi:hypothetical protein